MHVFLRRNYHYVSARKDCSAESPFIVYPFKHVHKRIVQYYPSMNSLVACVAACIDHRKCKVIFQVYKTSNIAGGHL